MIYHHTHLLSIVSLQWFKRISLPTSVLFIFDSLGFLFGLLETIHSRINVSLVVANLLSRIEGLLEIWFNCGLFRILLLLSFLLDDFNFLLLFWWFLSSQCRDIKSIEQLILLLLFLDFDLLFSLFERSCSVLSVKLFFIKFNDCLW